MINLFLPKGWNFCERNRKTYTHSITVAKAAKKISEKINGIDSKKAYIYGLMHDLGKFFLTQADSYKHPRVGYDILKEAHHDIAEICISHGFPDFNLSDHILHYCKNDINEAKKVSSILKNVKMNDYIELIQLCDKISTLNSYVTIETKLNWYMENYNIQKNELIECYGNRLNNIKSKFDRLLSYNIYELIGAV